MADPILSSRGRRDRPQSGQTGETRYCREQELQAQRDLEYLPLVKPEHDFSGAGDNPPVPIPEIDAARERDFYRTCADAVLGDCEWLILRSLTSGGRKGVPYQTKRESYEPVLLEIQRQRARLKLPDDLVPPF